MSDIYYQPPLSMLAFGKDEVERLRTITSYCAINIGYPLVIEMSPKERKEFLSKIPEAEWPRNLRRSEHFHLAILAGLQKLGMYGGCALTINAQWQRASTHISDMRKLQGGDSPLVRLRHDLVWGTINGEFTYRSFSVLCAVYSSIGGKQFPYQITRDAIRARAMGYKAAAILFDAAGRIHDAGLAILKQRQDNASPLTVDQVRWTLDEVEARGWFHRCHASKRRTYFSHRMTRENMLAWFKQNPPPSRKIEQLRAGDAKLRAQIYQKQKAKPYYSGDAIIVGTTSEQSLQSPQSVPTQPPVTPHDRPHDRPHCNRNSLIETSSIEGAREQIKTACARTLSQSNNFSPMTGKENQKAKSNE